ncbi:MAG: hypothetical protein ACO1N9_12185 [Flavobacterium sp.]
MTSQDIIDSINNYLAILTDDKALTDLYAQGNYFEYDYSQAATLSTQGHVHAYPGIYNGALYFFMIPAEHDNQTDAADIADYTQCCPIMLNGGVGNGKGSHRIPDTIAGERIQNWIDNYAEWIPLQVASEYGMVKAFSISKEDFETDDDVIFLALKENLESSVNWTADLIVANLDALAELEVTFDDYVHTVPPFSSAIQQEKFYMLTI